ncbi:MAG: hypothetical protein QOH57_3813 [Mycobacterium sp.]|nr:hypothetical protein [Mycobacterium sp.]
MTTVGRFTQPVTNPWRALWAMLVGFFMILVDSTIVAVANPRIMEKLDTDYDAVIWVTSAYLLAYAVPLLVSGRLGDRFGPKNLYLVGLAVFTGASLWCGLAGSIQTLIAARVVQGLGAALLTPQTLSTITRIFPPERRGVAMSVWGATAGVATLVGPLAGGALVDSLGWQWIFFVNVPVGIVGFGLAVWLIPVLPTSRHGFDILGVVLSGVAMFLIVFGLQEGQSHDWALWIWAAIGGGVAMMVAFVYWQSVNRNEPLIPLQVFADRDFSLSNIGITVMGFVVVAMVLPLMFYLQSVRGLSPTSSALVMAPTAVVTGLLAPVVGRLVDRFPPRPIVGFGFSVLSVALLWLSIEMTPTVPIWRLTLPFAAMGLGMAFIWAPLAATATRNLPPRLAGAGSGVYNATRQVGSVLGSASMAAFMTWRISHELPVSTGGAPRGEGAVTRLPGFLHEPFSTAMSISMLLPAFVALFGIVAAIFLVGMKSAPSAGEVAGAQGGYDDDDDARTDVFAAIGEGGSGEHSGGHLDDEAEYLDEDDDYVEYLLEPPRLVPAKVTPPAGDSRDAVGDSREDPVTEDDTEPLNTRADVTRAELVALRSKDVYETLYHEPPEQWLHSAVEPIGFAHNGFHVDHEPNFQPLDEISVTDSGAVDDEPPAGRHAARDAPQFSRSDADGGDYGRHSLPGG